LLVYTKASEARIVDEATNAGTQIPLNARLKVSLAAAMAQHRAAQKARTASLNLQS